MAKQQFSSADPRKYVAAFEARTHSLRPLSRVFASYYSKLPEKERHKVQTEQAITRIYDQYSQANDPFIVEHTNSVYLKRSKRHEGSYDLVVYVDNSMIAAELNARRELVRLKYRELFGMAIDVFDIRISRGRYKENHPFKKEKDESCTSRPLSDADKETIHEVTSFLEEGPLKDSFEKAIAAQKSRKNQN